MIDRIYYRYLGTLFLSHFTSHSLNLASYEVCTSYFYLGAVLISSFTFLLIVYLLYHFLFILSISNFLNQLFLFFSFSLSIFICFKLFQKFTSITSLLMFAKPTVVGIQSKPSRRLRPHLALIGSILLFHRCTPFAIVWLLL